MFGRSRLRASSVTKNDHSIALSRPQNRTARHPDIAWIQIAMLAVNHHPVGDLLPPSILKPLSSSRFCVAHISRATVANTASSSFAHSSKRLPSAFVTLGQYFLDHVMLSVDSSSSVAIIGVSASSPHLLVSPIFYRSQSGFFPASF
jgi:hypothetical protein